MHVGVVVFGLLLRWLVIIFLVWFFFLVISVKSPQVPAVGLHIPSRPRLDWKRCPVEYFISELKCYSNASLCFTRFSARKLRSIFSVRILSVSLFLSLSCLRVSISHSFSYCGHAAPHTPLLPCCYIIYISVTRDAFCRCRYNQFSRAASEMGCIHVSSHRRAIILLQAFEKSLNIPYLTVVIPTRKVWTSIFWRTRAHIFMRSFILSDWHFSSRISYSTASLHLKLNETRRSKKSLV